MTKVKSKNFGRITWIKNYLFLLAPLLVLSVFLLLAKKHDLYPLGSKSMAWADVTQQVIPLLNSFKDILAGKTSFVYNVNQAGGMSFFAIFFFFLSSPASFLVIFVTKAKMMVFVNILIMLKLMFASLTMGYYLQRKYPTLPPFVMLAFALLYSFSAYNLMYYQNMMWLVMMGLFPLLFLSIERILTKGKFVSYFILMSVSMVINYYIGMLEVLIILMVVALYFFLMRRDAASKKYALHFTLISFFSALVALVVLLPSLYAYLTSARSESFIDALRRSWFITNFMTTLPLLLGVLFLIFFVAQKQEDTLGKVKLIMLGLLLIPLVIDPINKALHFGSYQAFPLRFFFIVLFFILDLSAAYLATKEGKYNVKHELLSLFSIVLILVLVYFFAESYVTSKSADLDAYATSLWGDLTSLEALLRYYFITILSFGVIVLLARLHFVTRKTLGVAIFGFSVIEAMFAFAVYVVPASRTDTSYQTYYELANIIEDESFYRVKTRQKYHNVNDVGAMGYATLGHYTSLTNEDYMFAMKKLGYSSYWMEVGPYGGTSFTDALLRNKYTINAGSSALALYQTTNYYISENKVLPFGLITTTNLATHELLAPSSRPLMQEALYETLFPNASSPLHTIYPYTSQSEIIIEDDNGVLDVNVNGSGTLTYEISIANRTSLYFEAFNEYTNHLVEPFNETIKVFVNSASYAPNLYPTKSSNGALSLGTYENETVTVRVTINDDIILKSLNVYGVNETILDDLITTTKSANILLTPQKLTGSYNASTGEEYVFLPLVYNKGLRLRINNKKHDVMRVFDTFIAFKLAEGHNDFVLTFHEPGFALGLTLSLGGLFSFGVYLYVLTYKKITVSPTIEKVNYYALIVVGGVVFFVTYILSLIINVLSQFL